MNQLNKITTQKKFITADALKWIALVTMFIDHIGASILEKIPQYSLDSVYTCDLVLRFIGRLAFPIYCFLMVEGFYHTRSRMKYLRNMLIFAVVSEIPFELSFLGGLDIGFHNVYWTLLLGLIMMMALEEAKTRYSDKYTIWALLALIVCAGAAQLASTDYGATGVILIFILYQTHNERLKQCILGAVAFSFELTAPISFVLIYFYNGQRKNKKLKYFFYLFYPLHLLLLYWVRLLIV